MASTGLIDPSSSPGPAWEQASDGTPALWQRVMDQAGLGQPDAAGPAKASSDAPGLGGTTLAFVAPGPVAPVAASLASPAPSADPAAFGALLSWAARNAPLLARGAAGGLAGGILVTPTNIGERQTTVAGVAGHPHLGLRLDRTPGDLSGTATLYGRGPDGGQASPGIRLDLDPQGRLTGQQGTSFAGLAFGALPPGGDGRMQLAPGLAAALAGHAAPQAGLGSGDTPPAALPRPQVGFSYETRTQAERDRAAEMQSQGRSGADIAAELDRMRRNAGMAATGGAGKEGTEGAKETTAPTPRDGVVGGTPTGAPEPILSRAKREKQEGLRLQAESEDAMAAAGYQVERRPTVREEDGIAPGKDPDMRLGGDKGNIADAVAPWTSNPDKVRRAVSDKVKEKQAFHIVLNLGRTEVTRGQVEALLRRKPIAGLRELFIIEQNGAISRTLPEPEQITTAPQARPPHVD